MFKESCPFLLQIEEKIFFQTNHTSIRSSEKTKHLKTQYEQSLTSSTINRSRKFLSPCVNGINLLVVIEPFKSSY